jgi:hypothetical protein
MRNTNLIKRGIVHMAAFGEISAAITSLKVAFDLAKTIIGARDEAIIREKVVALQNEILQARDQALTIQARDLEFLQQISDLKKEVADLKAWDAEKGKYQLTKLTEFSNVFAYTLKEQTAAGVKIHYCPNCFQEGRLSILQAERRTAPIVDLLVCPRCGTELLVRGHLPHPPARRKR